MKELREGDPLIEYLDARDDEHYKACVRALQSRVVRAAAKVLGDRSRAEDVAQDLFMRLLDPEWEPEGIRLGVKFLVVRAKKLARARLLAEERRRAREQEAVANRGAWCRRNRNGHGRDENLDLDEAVEALPAAMRVCVNHRRAGLTVEEIVEVTGFSRNKVFEILADAYRRLKRRLGDSAGALLLTALLDLPEAPAGIPVPEGFEAERPRFSRRECSGRQHPRARESCARTLFPWLPLALPAGAAVVLGAILFVRVAAVGPGADDLWRMPQDRGNEGSTPSELPPMPGPPAAAGRRPLDHLDINWALGVPPGKHAERNRSVPEQQKAGPPSDTPRLITPRER